MARGHRAGEQTLAERLLAHIGQVQELHDRGVTRRTIAVSLVSCARNAWYPASSASGDSVALEGFVSDGVVVRNLGLAANLSADPAHPTPQLSQNTGAWERWLIEQR